MHWLSCRDLTLPPVQIQTDTDDDQGLYVKNTCKYFSLSLEPKKIITVGSPLEPNKIITSGSMTIIVYLIGNNPKTKQFTRIKIFESLNFR